MCAGNMFVPASVWQSRRYGCGYGGCKSQLSRHVRIDHCLAAWKTDRDMAALTAIPEGDLNVRGGDRLIPTIGRADCRFLRDLSLPVYNFFPCLIA